MNLCPGSFYHIYNRGNNRERIFYSADNYLYFTRKIRRHIEPHCHVLAYCLMPNHFHLLIGVREEADQNRLALSVRSMLSSYTRAIQRQENRTGSLFQQNTRAKDLTAGTTFYGQTCFCYIHQNPLRAGLVAKLDDWPFSSYLDFVGSRPGRLVDQEAARDVLDLPVAASEMRELILSTLPIEDIEQVL